MLFPAALLPLYAIFMFLRDGEDDVFFHIIRSDQILLATRAIDRTTFVKQDKQTRGNLISARLNRVIFNNIKKSTVK